MMGPTAQKRLPNAEFIKQRISGASMTWRQRGDQAWRKMAEVQLRYMIRFTEPPKPLESLYLKRYQKVGRV